MTTTVVNNSLFRSLFEKQKLTGNNFLEWYHNLWIVLSTEDKLPFLEQPIPVLLVPPQGQANPPDVVTTHQAWVKAHKEIVGLMLMTMDLDIQKNLEHLGAYDMLKELKKFYIENLEHLGHAMTQNLSVSLILVSLRKEYDSFVQNYNMHSMGKTKNQKKKSYKAAKGNQGKGKAKIGYAPVQAPPFAPKPKNPPTPKKDNPAKDVICHQCGKVGHWRRNCPIYLSELMKKKKLSHGASTSVKDSTFVKLLGLMGSRKLKLGALSLYVGDGHRAAVEAIGDYHLCLPSGLVLILHNCHYAPSITRGIILVSRLYKDGFVNRFENDNSIFDFKNNMIYFNAIPQDDIYGIVMSSSNTNESSMYAVTNKRAKLNLESALLWHCHLRHINKKRLEKLQHDGLLDSTDIKSFEKCVACMSVIDHEASGSLEDLEIIQEGDTHHLLNTSLDHEEDDQEIDEPQSDIDPIRDLGKPANYKAALLDPESDKWLNAMNVEMQFMKDNEVWELVELPPSTKTVGHKWLFKKKTNMDGDVHTYKARLVAKGFTQTPRIDYEETFSPVADIRAIRILIAIATFYDYEIWQMDVKNYLPQWISQ
ncbi:zinc finger, CCHC-type containing protein [Tanacetum coccineum]|uniref:Zinc finger, CCHC-type containing protein n=1 Tax=Tanacetum coccineum TaxID=301880 RepID=A0ABQ5CQZ7_9ASTR